MPMGRRRTFVRPKPKPPVQAQKATLLRLKSTTRAPAFSLVTRVMMGWLKRFPRRRIVAFSHQFVKGEAFVWIVYQGK